MRARFGMNRTTGPDKCTCGKKLPEPKYGRVPKVSGFDNVYHVYCKCGELFVWGWVHSWKRRSELPLFDDRLVVKECP